MFKMVTGRASQVFLSAIITASTLLLVSCGREVSKGDVYQRISRDVHIGADRSEVRKYLEPLDINGIKPAIHDDYQPAQPSFSVVGPDEKSVEVAGMIFATFRNSRLQLLNFCPATGVIFYFDKSNKLITYHIDCFG
jgi:hypothetical protein